MTALAYTSIPIAAVLIGALFAVWRRPGPAMVSATQHLAAGVVFAAAASEILPDVLHQGSPTATLIGGALGVLLMLGLRALEERAQGPLAFLLAVGIDIFIDGLVLGLAFVAGQTAGLLLTIALTFEILFLALTVTNQLGDTARSRMRTVALTVALALLLPVGVVTASPVATFPPVVLTGFLSFGLMALLYLVTEELLREAHERPDTPLVSAMFFIGFLGLLLIEETIG